MKLHRTKHYNETMKGSLESMSGCQDITLIFQPQEKHRYLGIGDAKELFKTAIALTSEWWSGRAHDVREGELAVPAKTLLSIEEEGNIEWFASFGGPWFNYLITMDEDDEEDIDVGKNDHLLEF